MSEFTNTVPHGHSGHYDPMCQTCTAAVPNKAAIATELTKMTVNLIPKSVEALDLAATLTGDTRTDIVNRAIQLYAEIHSAAVAFDVVITFRTGARQRAVAVYAREDQP